MPEVFTGEKSYEDAVLAAKRSVVDRPGPTEAAWSTPSLASGINGADSVLWYVAQAADDILGWGINTTVRDAQLRQFVPSESVLCSAIASVAARNAGFTWVLEGDEALTDAVHEILHSANMGAGWMDFVIRLSIDLYTQDKGAFVEIIREGDSPDSPVIGIQTLDAGRCWHTGNPEEPVIYLDRKGKYHRLKWYQVRALTEIPTPHETLYGIQMCAVSRVLKMAQRWRNTQIYLDEKTGGRNTRAVHVVSGVADSALQAAIARTKSEADNRGQIRYMNPVVVTTLKPDAAASVATLDFASLPDGFNEESAFKQYLTIIALGLFTDFQEFAPLPGGGLGTSMQSQILHLKGQGKGPALFRKLMEHLMNFGGVLPRTVEFRYDDQDIEAEKAEADVRKVRADTVAALVEKAILDPAAARQLLLDWGDIPQEVFDRLDQAEMLGDVTGPAPVAQLDTANMAPERGQPMTPAESLANNAPVTEASKDASEDRAGPDAERLKFEGEVADAAESAFAKARAIVERLLEA